MFQNRMQNEFEEQRYQDVEQRLAAYYGPPLPPRALSEAAWFQLRDQLGQARPQPRQRRRMRWPRFARSGRGQMVPSALQEIFASLILRTDYRRPSPELRCRFSPHLAPPGVWFSPLGRGQVRLMLSEQNWYVLQQTELEVLLAVGLARSAGASRVLFLLPRVLCAASLLLAMATLPLTTVDRRYLWIFSLAFACCVAGVCLISWQKRVETFRGDRQAVQWLGREHVCRGLHLLAERGHPRHPSVWGEPSLDERIARVCGSPVTTRDERLTLVG